LGSDDKTKKIWFFIDLGIIIIFGIRPNFCESEKVTVVSEWDNLPWLYNAFQVGKL